LIIPDLAVAISVLSVIMVLMVMKCWWVQVC